LAPRSYCIYRFCTLSNPFSAFPGILANARYVYVASYDGDQFDPNLLPEDRDAINAVQNTARAKGS